eukprot:CAMPEP_0197925888 /NCGR_PEP_ID=MMETSP1439-20131203/98247_1 /TAXON_ID=66791 /ORGANISM="Gonyaulax spinifera, Strain CCMP409" /LENGTH=35 /DNA_ID= /DNA_START= /DNA_END= /DNA_ORIENTATION=
MVPVAPHDVLTAVAGAAGRAAAEFSAGGSVAHNGT